MSACGPPESICLSQIVAITIHYNSQVVFVLAFLTVTLLFFSASFYLLEMITERITT